MRKSARDLITSLVVVIVMAALVGFFGWATNGFKNADRFKQWFGMAQTELDKLIDGEEPDEAEKDAAEVKARNGGIQLDSDDAIATVAVIYCTEPTLSLGSDGVYVEAVDLSSYLRGDVCQIDVAPHVFFGSGFYVGERKTLATFSYGGNDGSGISMNDYCVTSSEIRELFPEVFADGCGCSFTIYAKTLAMGNYLESNDATTNVYVAAEDPTIVFEDTTVKIGKIQKDTLPIAGGDGMRDNFFNCINIKVRKVGSFKYEKDEMTFYNETIESDYPAFTQDEEWVYIDLTQFSFVENPGQYFIEFTQVLNSIIAPGSTGGGAYWLNNVPVLRDYRVSAFEITKLAAPTNITYEDCKLGWEYSDDVSGFAVFDGDTLLAMVDDPELDLKDYTLEEGEHMFRIRALGNVGNSLAQAATMSITPFNASSNITQLVAMTYHIGDDAVTKFVPLGKQIGDYLYDVEVDGAVFGGWYKDAGYSIAVEPTDKLTGDVAVYARLSAIETTDRPLTWWERNMWYVLGPIIGIFAVSIIAVIIKVVRDRRVA